MALENAQYIWQLVQTNPDGNDPVAEGDNHLRMIKKTLQQSFPGMTAPWKTTNKIQCADPVAAADVVTLGFLQNQLATFSTYPIGWPLWWLSDSLPTVDWMPFDGRALSRTLYPALFTLYGTKYGIGDGSTTFNIPDVRGYFPRFPTGSSGRDPNYAQRTARSDGVLNTTLPGSTQSYDVERHEHTMPYRNFNSMEGAGGEAGLIGTGTHNAKTNLYPVDGLAGAETRPKNIYIQLICRAK